MQSYQLCTLIDLENCKLFLIQFWKMSESLLLHSFWICSNIQCFPGRNSLKRRTLSENGNLEYIFIKSSSICTQNRTQMHTESFLSTFVSPIPSLKWGWKSWQESFYSSGERMKACSVVTFSLFYFLEKDCCVYGVLS